VRTVLGIRGRDGAFAEYLSLPAANLHALPDSIDDLAGVFVEPLAAACRVAEQTSIAPGMRAAVVGPGRLGLLVAQVLRHHGADVVVLARGRASRARAGDLGFETALPSDAASSLARSCDVAVDATGGAEGFAIGASLVRPRGTLVIKSTFHGHTPVEFSPLVVDEITVIGSRCGPFAHAIELLAERRVDVGPFLGATFPLEQFEAAFRHAREGHKAIFRP
jgi:threonine dehydrogenase-like Zn-dependent dehydrogenase